jgi:eukaryotic-like serine/threonine-protein kinase
LTHQTVRRLGQYSLIHVVGRGSTGIVYKAHDEKRDRYVAVKTMDERFIHNLALHESFYREAKLAAKLRHPHILRIYKLGQTNGELFLAMELLDGKDLKQILMEGSVPKLEERIKWMIQLTEALSFAHSQGIIHCDIKPGNLHICSDARLVVMDFGIAKAAAAPQVGATVGTPDYLSPEQVLGVRTDHRSDIFSSGIVFYELLTGKHPFRSKSLPSTIHRILNDTPAIPEKLKPQIPARLGKLVLRAMERNVNARYQNFEELLEELRAV